MKQKKINNRLLLFLCGLIVWGALSAVWGIVWYEYFAETIQLPFFRKGNWAVIAIYAALLYLITHFYGGYRIGYYRRGDVIFSGILAMGLTNVITYAQTSVLDRHFVAATPFFWMSCIQFVMIWIWATWAHKLYLQINPPRRLLLVYGDRASAEELTFKLTSRDDKYRIQEAVGISEGLDEVKSRIMRHKAVLFCDIKSGNRNTLLKFCYANSIRVYMTPKLSDIIIRGATDNNLFDTPLLLSRNQGLGAEQAIIKRVMDILLSFLGLVLASPFMLAVAAAIKLEDNGPILYRQNRLTIDGKEFLLIKFRSMKVDAEKESGIRLASKDDDRITGVGRFIRRTRLDEVPQLFNVLKGDMSLVGPRPERPEIAAQYRQQMKEFDYRLKVKAGLTGQAQVVGKYNTSAYDKLKMDLMYITNYSVVSDIKLILMTIKILFMKESTEGVDNDRTIADTKQRGDHTPV